MGDQSVDVHGVERRPQHCGEITGGHGVDRVAQRAEGGWIGEVVEEQSCRVADGVDRVLSVDAQVRPGLQGGVRGRGFAVGALACAPRALGGHEFLFRRCG
ncbi:hypothetical protein AB0L25_36845 [Spirillospora sp. NPDC052242]